MKKRGVLLLLLILAFTEPLYALDFTKDLPSPLKSVDDVNYYARSLEEQERDNKLEFSQLAIYDNLVPNKALMEAHSFLTMQDIRVTYYYSKKTEYQIAALIIMQNTADDSSMAGRTNWMNMSILSDVSIGSRHLLGRYFFLGVGAGLGIFVSITNNVLNELIFDRIFIYQEMGLNLRETSRSVFTISVSIREGLQLKGIPALMGARNRLINGTTGFIWRYLF